MALKHADRFWKIFAAVLVVLISTKLSRATSTVDPAGTVGNTCLEWTEWMDDEHGGTLDPSSIGEFELINDLRKTYGFCNETTDIECALANDTNTPYNETGQVSLTCDTDQGFLCFHSQQSGDCFNYAIRVLCETPCQAPTTRGKANTRTSSTSMQYSSRLSTYLGTDIVTQPSTTVGKTCTEWTEWMDDENGGTLDPSSIGEFELINDLRKTYGFCNETTDIECALANDTNTPYNETGQVSLTCDTDQGFLCFHSQQSGDCFNYAIRVLCEAPCPSLTTQGNRMTELSSTLSPFSTDVSIASSTGESTTTSKVHTTTELASTDLKTSPNSGKSQMSSSTEFSTLSNTEKAVSTSDAQTPSQRTPTTANNQVTDIRTDPPTECPPADSGDCSEENLLCKTEYEVKASMNSEANFGPCVPQNVSEAFANEQRENLRDEMPLCCLQCVFNRGENSRRRRDTSGDIVTVVSRILVYDNSTVTAEAVLEAFVSSVRQSSVLGSYGLSYINGTASVVKQDLEPATPKPENASFKMVVVICSTIAGLVVVITVALCFVCIIQRSFPTGKRGRKPAIYRNPLSKTQEGTLLMKEWSFGSATPKGKRQWTDKISAGVDTGSKDKLNVSSRERSDQMVSKRWSYLYGRGPNEQPRASEVQKGAHSLPRPGGYSQEKGQRGTDNYQEHVHSNGQRVTGRPDYAAFPKVIIRPPAQQRNLYYNIDSIGYSGYTL